MYFHLTCILHVKVDSVKELSAASSRIVVRTSNLKISCRHFADEVTRMSLNACCTCNTIIFPLSSSHIILWYCRCRWLEFLIFPNLGTHIKMHFLIEESPNFVVTRKILQSFALTSSLK